MPTAEAAWTTRRLLDWMNTAFRGAGLDSPRLSAEILVSAVLGCDRLRLYMDPDRPASPDERDRLRDLTRRALAHEPIQYLVGRWSFFGLQIACDARALIPRPSTETIPEHALQHARRPDAAPFRRIADIGTGTGCLAIALARHLPNAAVIATDLSVDALSLAAENIEAHGLTGRVELRHGHLLGPLRDDGPFDLIVSNPPYIPDHEWPDVPPNVKDHEPHLALRGGHDGLDLIRGLIKDAPPLLAAGAWIMIEAAASNAHDAAALMIADGRYDAHDVLDDVDGLPRVAIARRRSTD